MRREQHKQQTQEATTEVTMGDFGEYYRFFEEHTENGIVFNEDLSNEPTLPVTNLLSKEVTARQKWAKTHKKLIKEYKHKAAKIENTDDLLLQRLAPPKLVLSNPSSRSKPSEARSKRRYPAKIAFWADFEGGVKVHSPPKRSFVPSMPPFLRSLEDGGRQNGDEKEEEVFLTSALHQTLTTARLIGEFTTRMKVTGRPDVALMEVDSTDDDDDEDDSGQDDMEVDGGEDKKEVRIICEFKSTHNLPITMKGTDICAVYEDAYKDVYVTKTGRTVAWSRTCHPIGQLLGYMTDNSRRYGVLSSGTRTYFVRIWKTGSGEEQVQISNAWFVGQQNYLRAWVYINQLAGEVEEPLETSKLDWAVSTSGKGSPAAKGTRSQPSRSSKNTGLDATAEGDDTLAENPEMETEKDFEDVQGDSPAPVPSSLLPWVPFSDIRIIKPLGSGRCGTVFLAEWEGLQVALKQFDVDKTGDSFCNELQAYSALQEAWGRLVPKAYFLSQSWSGGVLFLGLQLGRQPKPGDNVSHAACNRVLASLEEHFGLRHDDPEGNMLMIPDSDSGKERLVAIDFEDVTMIKV